MRLLLLLAALLIFAGTNAQTTNDTPQPQENIVREPEVNIPGTKVYLLRPEGARFAKTFSGLEMDKAVIQIYDLQGGNYYTNGATFSRSGFEQKGAKVYEYRETVIDGYPAKFVKMSANMGISYSLIFGDSTFSVMAVGILSADDAKLASDVKTCLFSIKYKKDIQVDPFANSIFKLKENASRLKFVFYSGNMHMFNYSGKKENQDKTEPIVMVSSMPTDASITPESLCKDMVASIMKKSGSTPTIIDKSANRVNGYDAYAEEITFDASNGDKKGLYITVLKDGAKALTVLCMSSNVKTDIDVKEFKKFVSAITFK